MDDNFEIQKNTDTHLEAVNCSRELDFGADNDTLTAFDFFYNNQYNTICPPKISRSKMRLKNFKEDTIQESYEFRI